MPLTTDDIHRLAKLARIDITAAETDRTLVELNTIFSMVETLQAVNTAGLEPLCHPIATIQEMQLRLRDLGVTVEDTWLADCVSELYAELDVRGLRLRPHVWISDEWFSPAGVPGFAIPF